MKIETAAEANGSSTPGQVCYQVLPSLAKRNHFSLELAIVQLLQPTAASASTEAVSRFHMAALESFGRLSCRQTGQTGTNTCTLGIDPVSIQMKINNIVLWLRLKGKLKNCLAK